MATKRERWATVSAGGLLSRGLLCGLAPLLLTTSAWAGTQSAARQDSSTASSSAAPSSNARQDSLTASSSAAPSSAAPSSAAPSSAAPGSVATSSAAPEAAKAAGSTSSPSAKAAGPHEALPFIEDDFPRALAAARKQRVPLFIDAWAPWCHTCIFMRNYVFTDPALTSSAGRFVWLSINTENPVNAPFLEKYPISALPTFLIVDQDSETAALKWLGSATVPQMVKLFDDGDNAVHNTGGNPAEVALARADRLNAEGKSKEAIQAYREALKQSMRDWPRRPRTIESLVFALQSAEANEECVQLARGEGLKLAPGSSYANVVSYGLICALSAPEKTPWRAAAVKELEAATRGALAIDGLLGDDRSGLYDVLVTAAEERGDKVEVKKLAGDWLTFLEGEAARATNPSARAVYDPHRVGAALKLGEPARVIDALTASERDLPDDYNAPARLAVVYRELGRYDEALAAADRALAKAYGPRKLRVYETKASILEKKGDKPAARQTFQDELKFAETLPKGQKSDRTLERIRAEIARLN